MHPSFAVTQDDDIADHVRAEGDSLLPHLDVVFMLFLSDRDCRSKSSTRTGMIGVNYMSLQCSTVQVHAPSGLETGRKPSPHLPLLQRGVQIGKDACEDGTGEKPSRSANSSAKSRLAKSCLYLL